MNRFEKILAVVGHGFLGSRQEAVTHALDLVIDGPTHVCLLSVFEEFPRVARWLLRSSDELIEVIERERSQRLDSLAAEIMDEGLVISRLVLKGRLDSLVPQLVREDGYDLVILTAEDAGDRRLSSGERHVVRDCSCPVYLIRPGQETWPTRRVLAAVDPAPMPDTVEGLRADRDGDEPSRRRLNQRILETAAAMTARSEGELHVVHAWHVPGETLLRGESLVPKKEMDDYVEGMEQAARRGLDDLLESTNLGVEGAQVHFLKGDPAEVIVRVARANQVDLIVMGTVGRTGIHGLLIGNTAEATLRRVECSVLTLRPEGSGPPGAGH
jgi:nucleotide-binding universal stress UspA family protein